MNFALARPASSLPFRRSFRRARIFRSRSWWLLVSLSLLCCVSARAQTFSNPTRIQTPVSGAASPYPSQITVSGVSGRIGDVNVTLHGFSHANPSEMDILLVGPGGQRVMLVSDVGGVRDVLPV